MLRTLALSSLALLFACAASTSGQDAPASEARPILASFNLSKKDLAIDGYDPVAYFPEGGGKPAKGKKDLTATYRGATYRFASVENRGRFLAEPSRYEPAYGGWCAYAMASDDRVGVDPKSFLIEDESLLLFYDGFLADTRKMWGKEGPEELRKKADGNWVGFASEGRHRDVSGWRLDGGVALGGRDPVSYSKGAPVEGKAELAVKHRGVTYRFASEANRDAFLAAPGRYEPAYGGWAAGAMARGERVAPDDGVYVVEGDGVVLFADAAARDAWKADGASATKAGEAWARMGRR